MKGLNPLILLMAAMSMNGARLEIADAVMGLHSSVTLAIQIRTEGATIAGIQFDLQFPNNFVAVSVLPGLATRDALKQVYQNEFSSGHKRVLIAGMNRTVIGDGAAVLLYVSSTGSEAGEYELRLSNVAAADADGNPVRLDIKHGVIRTSSSLQATPLLSDGVLNTASFLPGPIAAGELLTLLGVRLNSPDSVVTFNGTKAPILFSNGSQINTLAPVNLDAGEVTIEVLQDTNSLAQVTVPVAVAAPGIFTEDLNGTGPAIVVLEDGSRSSALNPAMGGSTVSVYATGLNSPAEVMVRIGTAEALVSGVVQEENAPGLVRIFIKVPEGISGSVLPFTLRSSGISSQSGVTMSIASHGL